MSRIIKKDEVADLPPLDLTAVGPIYPEGVQPFQMRQVGPLSSRVSQSAEKAAGPSRESHQMSGSAAAAGAARGRGREQPDRFSWPVTTATPEAEDDQESIREQAFREGFAKGEQAATQRSAKKVQAAIESLGSMAEQLASLKGRLRSEAERELVALSLVIARRVIRRELTVDPKTVLAIVRTCLEEFRRAEIQRLQVNPQDLEMVRGYFDSKPNHNLELVSDSAVPPGGVILQTVQGELDARVETQLKEIEYGLTDE